MEVPGTEDGQRVFKSILEKPKPARCMAAKHHPTVHFVEPVFEETSTKRIFLTEIFLREPVSILGYSSLTVGHDKLECLPSKFFLGRV